VPCVFITFGVHSGVSMRFGEGLKGLVMPCARWNLCCMYVIQGTLEYFDILTVAVRASDVEGFGTLHNKAVKKTTIKQ
jgi:hypothetical protein